MPLTASHDAAPRASSPPGRLVTDAPTRLFHALFALSFLGAYLSAESERWRLLHVTLGYTMAGLLGFRVLYGLFGPRQAGLGPMWRKLASAPAWLRSLVQRQPGQAINWRQGQNLLMASAVVGLLVLALPLTLSGHAVYQDWGDALGGEGLGELHEVLANAFLVLVLGHLALILGLSVWRRQNQALPMLTGRVAGPGPDLVKQPRRWLAALLLLAVLAFGAWMASTSPQGLIPAQHSAAPGGGGHGAQDDDD